MAIKSSRGQSLIEFSLSLTLLTALTSGFLGLGSYVASWFWIRHQTQEMAFCRAQSHSDCKQRLRRHLAEALPFGTVDEVILKNSDKAITAGVRYRLFSNLAIHEVQILDKPVRIAPVPPRSL